ncbi:MAG: tetratricopeptide repeat protein [Dyadobacter sp.]
MEKSLILFLSMLFVPDLGFSQSKIDCSSKVAQDSLLEVYSKKAWKFGYNHPDWEASWDSLIAICPNIAEAYQEKAIPYLKSGDYAKTFELEDKAVELDPKRWIAYRGFLHCIFTKNYSKALADFQLAEQLVPNASVMDHTYSFFCGLSFLETGELEQAEKMFQKDIEQQKSRGKDNDIHFNSLLYLGIVHLEMNEYIEAERNFRDCLNYYSQMPEANYYLARVLKATGNTDSVLYFAKAKEYYDQGYRINEDNEAYVNYPRQISLIEVEQK